MLRTKKQKSLSFRTKTDKNIDWVCNFLNTDQCRSVRLIMDKLNLPKKQVHKMERIVHSGLSIADTWFLHKHNGSRHSVDHKSVCNQEQCGADGAIAYLHCAATIFFGAMLKRHEGILILRLLNHLEKEVCGGDCTRGRFERLFDSINVVI